MAHLPVPEDDHVTSPDLAQRDMPIKLAGAYVDKTDKPGLEFSSPNLDAKSTGSGNSVSIWTVSDSDLSATISAPAKSPPSLPLKTKIFYSFGHLFNDMTVSIWFSFTLLFFQPRLSGGQPGALLLIGQIADALASPAIGFLSDRFASTYPFNVYGRRKTWHFIGVLFSLLSVPLLYNQCLLGEDQPESVQFIYYAILVVIFQSAWAATQVTHVALINDLTTVHDERIQLNSYRQAATMAANVAMYVTSFFIIRSISGDQGDNTKIDKKDAVAFTYLSYAVCVFGIIVTGFFYAYVPEPDSPIPVEKAASDDAKMADNEDSLKKPTQRPGKASWHRWFVSLGFWTVASIYTMARMFVNVVQVFAPLYLQHFLKMERWAVSVVPLLINLISFATSFAVNPLASYFGSKMLLFIGSLAGMVVSMWINHGDNSPNYDSVQVFLVACLIGVVGTMLLLSAMALNADLVGTNNAATNAFVFAAMSLVDKSINGIVIFGLEQFKPPHHEDGEIVFYYKAIMVLLTLLPSFGIFLLMGILNRTRYGNAGTATVVGGH